MILQQFKNPFNELIEKKIIVNWLLVKNLFDYEISFYHTHSFYEDYYNRLDTDIKVKINKGIAKLLKLPEKYQKFNDKINEYLSNTEFKTESELTNVKSYYSKYLYLNEFME